MLKHTFFFAQLIIKYNILFNEILLQYTKGNAKLSIVNLIENRIC